MSVSAVTLGPDAVLHTFHSPYYYPWFISFFHESSFDPREVDR